MKIPVIKKLAEHHTLEELEQAEQCLLEEKPLPIAVEGSDDGEVLTHIMAATWVIEKIASDDISLNQAIRAYIEKVRTSIS